MSVFVSSLKNNVIEGEEITINFDFPAKPNQYIYWQLESDVYWGGLPTGKESIVLGSFKGNILTDKNGEASFMLKTKNDNNYDGYTETIYIDLYSDSSYGDDSVFYGGKLVSIDDWDLVLKVERSTQRISEGDSLLISVQSDDREFQYLPGNATIYWAITKKGGFVNEDKGDFIFNQGVLNLYRDNIYEIKIEAVSDNSSEGDEWFDFCIYSDSQRLDLVTSRDFLISDSEVNSEVVSKDISAQLNIGTKYNLTNIKDYDGNLHGFLGDTPSIVQSAYKYQGKLDVNNDGVTEAIFTNKESGRWVTASIDPITGAYDYSKNGQGGTTRVVGIYEDPLVKAGIVEKDSVFDGSRTFINDLKLDNLILKTVGDYDSDGFQEVYWSKVDNTAYLRAVMHADGNIQYANYQNLDQATKYLTGHGFADTVALIS